MKAYYIIVRDQICGPRAHSDDSLKKLDCWFQSPIVSFDESVKIDDVVESIIEKYHIQERFRFPAIQITCVD